jgi:hypothetical protein
VTRHRRRLAVGGAVAAVLAVAACGAAPSGSSTAATAPAALGLPLATSLASAADTWAVVPMASDPPFWQVFARLAKSSQWRLATPPGAADNGGLVAAIRPDLGSVGVAGSGSGALTVAVRPSHNLEFTPLTATTNAGANWSPGGPVNAAVIASPDALAASGQTLLALVNRGGSTSTSIPATTLDASSDGGATWRPLPTPGASTASLAGTGCGAVTITSVSFWGSGADVLAGGNCGTGGAAALFSYSLAAPSAGWQRVSLPVSGQLVRLDAGLVLMRASAGLTALWSGPRSADAASAAWVASAPLPVTGAVTTSGRLASGGAWVLMADRRAAIIAAPGERWRLLTPVPAQTAVLASGPDGAIDALAASGATLTVWRLAPGAAAWSKVQTVEVPIQYGSSG